MVRLAALLVVNKNKVLSRLKKTTFASATQTEHRLHVSCEELLGRCADATQTLGVFHRRLIVSGRWRGRKRSWVFGPKLTCYVFSLTVDVKLHEEPAVMHFNSLRCFHHMEMGGLQWLRHSIKHTLEWSRLNLSSKSGDLSVVVFSWRLNLPVVFLLIMNLHHEPDHSFCLETLTPCGQTGWYKCQHQYQWLPDHK